MSYRRNGLKVLGLSLVAVLGLMAFMSVGAQANWKVAGAELEANESVKVSAHTEGNLLVPAQKLEILCAVVKQEGTLNLLAKSVKAEGKLAFETCKTWQNSKESPGCKPIEPIKAGGKAILILHNLLTYVLFEPPTVGGTFAFVNFNPAKCALAEENEVSGSLVAECVNSALTAGAKLCEEEAITHYLRQAPEALFPTDVLFFGENKAFIHGIAAVILNGGKAGAKWSGIV